MTASALILDGISHSYTDRPILTDVSLVASPEHRVGLIGENGVGKSTLLQIAAGTLDPLAGVVSRPTPTGLLHQELPAQLGDSFAAVLESAVAPLRQLERDLTSLAEQFAADPNDRSLADRYAEVLERAELADVWAIDARIARTVAGLGLADIEPARRVDAMSGGQRGRLALAALLLGRPTAVLLDEPTNHLDDAGMDFLADELGGWPGPVLFASHDRAFLDQVATRVVDLDPAPSPSGTVRQGANHTGSYSDYLRQRRLDRERWAEQYRAEQDELARLRHEVAVGARDIFHTTSSKSESRITKKFYSDKASNTVARRVRSAQSKLDALQTNQVRKPRPALRFAGFDRGRVGREAIAELHEAAVDGRLGAADLKLAADSRLLVTGPNGSGKSTLLRLLDQSLTPTSGAVWLAGGVRVGRLAQDDDWPDLTVTARALLGNPEGRVDTSGLVHPRDVDLPLGELSVGTRRRIALAVLLANPPELLLLDEPTNHLSLALSEELEVALDDYPGAVVIASHDRWLRRRWQFDTLALGEGSV